FAMISDGRTLSPVIGVNINRVAVGTGISDRNTAKRMPDAEVDSFKANPMFAELARRDDALVDQMREHGALTKLRQAFGARVTLMRGIRLPHPFLLGFVEMWSVVPRCSLRVESGTAGGKVLNQSGVTLKRRKGNKYKTAG